MESPLPFTLQIGLCKLLQLHLFSFQLNRLQIINEKAIVPLKPCRKMKIDFLKLSLVFCFLNTIFLSSSQTNVVFGERENSLNQTAVFFDREGKIYPDYFIADSSLQNCDASLAKWYISHSADFEKIAKLYNCEFTFPDEKSISKLNDSIMSFKIRYINSLTKNNLGLNVLVHGFRKSFKSQSNDRTATQDFLFWDELIETRGKYNVPSLKVYWDASYDCCFSTNSAKNDSLFEMFEQTYKRADAVGLALRSLLNKLECQQLNIIGHSLAAKVIQSCIYNVIPNSIPGLTQDRVNICLIAPATSGGVSWVNYLQRNVSIPYKDNVRLLILYNEKDFALRKKDNKFGLFGPGANKYGSTRLGCNKGHEAEKLSLYFAQHFPNSSLKLVDCTKLGRIHSSRFYFKSVFFDEVIAWIEPL